MVPGALVQYKRKEVAQLEGWAEEFGGDYELHLLGRRIIVVTGLADIRRMLTLRPSKFKRGLLPDQYTWASEQVGVKDSMFFAEGKVWGRSRRLISPNLNGHNVATMLPVMSKIGGRFCDKLEGKADRGEVVKARNSFARFAHDVIALAAFGVDVDSVSATVETPCESFDAMESKTYAVDKLLLKPLDMWGWKFLPMLPWVRDAKEHSRRLETVIQGAIDAVRLQANAGGAMAEGDMGVGGTLLRKIVGATRAKPGSERMLFSDREVMPLIPFSPMSSFCLGSGGRRVSLFVAGTETTALSLSWAMYYLSKRPEAVLRCRAEALKVAPLSDGIASTKEQLSQLEFCSAVFKEVLRLRTPGPVMALYGTEDFMMESGFVAEEGTGMFVLTRALGVSEEFFTRAKDFVPERWIESERDEALLGRAGAESSEGSAIAHDAQAFLSLGHGPRNCPGQDMAKAEAAIIIAAICARFDISMAPGQADPPEEISSFTQAGSGSGQHGVACGAGGYDMMSEDEQPRESAAGSAALKGAVKRTRVEGRGSSAAQRAAASEACKSISLERLQAQYHRPLSEVARDLKVSVARLLKKCREFGILRWPYRHVRSVQESIDQLEKDKQAATDEMATDDMELRLRLLRRRGELVAHFASCWLESDMRKGIFLADPRDVDSMLATAHEAHGRRRIPPPGWETLGRFPEMAVREHFLEQMRTYMVGGGTAMSPDSDSPHRGGQQHSLDTSSSSVEDTRERLRQQQMLQQQQQQQQAYGDGALQASWQHQRHQQYPNNLPPWQGTTSHLYGGGGGGGGGASDQGTLAHPNQFWGSGSSSASPASMSATGLASAAQRGWVSADLANPPRGEFSPSGGAAAGGASLPSIFQMSQQSLRVPDRPLSSFSSGAAGPAGPAGGGLRGAMGGGSEAGGGAGAGWGGAGAGGFPGDQPVVGGFDHRWGSAASAQLQQQQQQALGHMMSSGRWQGGGAGGGGEGVGSAMDAGIPRAGSFDHTYGGSATQGRHRGSEAGGGPEGQA
eukprot:g13003.t1